MSKKTESSLKVSVSSLASLHEAIRHSFPELMTGDLKRPMEEARKRAFNGTISHRWFKYNYVRSQVLKRYQHGSISPQARERTAIAKYLLSERKCRTTNKRLAFALDNSSLISRRTAELLRRSRKVALSVLGDLEWDELFSGYNHSGGATTEFCRVEAAIQQKWARGAYITERASLLHAGFVAWAGTPMDHKLEYQQCESAVFFTVPKNFEADRGCEKQATLNMALQKAIGWSIRTRLNRVGLLLPDAQERHGRYAQSGSKNGSLVTGDLRDASNSIALSLVHAHVGGTRWDRLIACTRHDTITINGRTRTVEKVSSMGNGFTFELETLLFYSMLKAVCGNAFVSVYGDDLVYPPKYHDEIVEFFHDCGFEFNGDKTFASGPFRESCGGHYFNGQSVKPFYIEQLPTDLLQVINLHNDIIAYHENMPPHSGYLEIAHQCRRLVPRKFWGPMGIQGCLWSEWDEATPRFKGKGTTSSSSGVIPHWRRVKVDGEWVTDPAVPASVQRSSARLSYQRWEILAVTKKVPTQRHEYYIGGLLASLWSLRNDKRNGQCKLRVTMEAIKLERFRHLRKLIDPSGTDTSMAEFYFPANAHIGVSRRAVGVAQQWHRLPVRVPS